LARREPSNCTSIITFDVPGSTSISATGINDAGQIVGTFTSGSDGASHCFLRSADGTTYTLIDAPGPKANWLSCSGINNYGQISGSFSDSNGFYGFVRSAAGMFTLFNAEKGPGASVGGINDLGEVVGAYSDAINGANGYVRRADGPWKRSWLHSWATPYR
jgi:probable HAF family extracellular repeat protein